MHQVKNIVNWLLSFMSHSICVEFDYNDATGEHHGRCDVRTFWLVGEEKLQHQLHYWGYRNIHIVK